MKKNYKIIYLSFLIWFWSVQGFAQAFLTTWVTNNNQITIPTTGTGYNYNITWTNLTNAGVGNGSATGQTGNYTLTGLENSSTYQVAITGAFPRIYFNNGTESAKIRTIAQWGNMAWTSMNNAFFGCSSLTYTATDAPNLSGVTDLSGMFRSCTNFNGNISGWNTSSVNNMSFMFHLASAFNQNIGGWNTTNITNMSQMFDGAINFNQNINSWNVGSVTNMFKMFQGAHAFKQDLRNWNTANVTNMEGMFYGNMGFNGDITTWNTSSVTNMREMFLGTTLFNQDISGWNVSNVTNMYGMFNGTRSFNQNISVWNTINVTNMATMFGNTVVFNQNISTWNTSNVTDMGGMFQNARAFNQNISTWNTSKVTAMTFMFFQAGNFNQNLGAWDVSKVTDMTNMLANTNMSIINYDNTLIGWASQTLKPNVTLTSTGLRYCNGQTARNTLTSAPNNWTISGDTYACVSDISVRGNNIDIAHNDLISNIQDNTDFGNFQSSGTLIRTFTILNRGSNNLNITNITSSNTGNFTISNITLPANVASNGTITFDVTFNANTSGIKSANIVIANNDANKSNYTFGVQGSIIQAIPDTKRGNALSFGGGGAAICSVFSPVQDYTIETWVRLNSTANQNIIVATNTGGPNFSYSHQIRVVGGKFSHYTLAGATVFVAGNEAVATNRWYHVVATYNSNGQVKLYVDGILQNVGQATAAPWNGLMRFDIGSSSGSLDAGLLSPLNGIVDEVRIWNIERTQAQIRENMHLTLSGTETGLLSYYQFNETAGNLIDPVSGRNGVFGGAVSRAVSTVSVGKGVSKTVSVTSVGAGAEVSLATANMEIDFSSGSANPNGELVISQITAETPHQNTTATNNTSSCYWIVRNFGTNTGLAFDNLKFQIPNHNLISSVDETLPTNLKLYRRSVNAGGSWTQIADANSASNATKQINFDAPTNTSFSEFIIGSSSSPLPITLLGLKGERIEDVRGEMTEEVRLEWSTASETNNKGFEIQVSDNAQNYKTIAFVEGKGNSVSLNSYHVTFNNASDGYYRLKQIDFDGKFSYSPVVFVEGLVGKVVVYPNPNNGAFNISVGKGKLDLPARLLNAQGIESLLTPEGGIYKVSHLPSGIYFLHTTVAGKVNVTKVIIER